jgi:hypothetical protein
VKGRTLAVIVVVGLAVVGWAVYALVAGDDRHPRASEPEASRHDDDPPRSPAARRSEPAPAPRPGSPAERAEPRRPPEPPKPDLTVEDAREQFDAYIAELDREIAKTEETDRDLPNEAWVEYYRRGHEAMDPLRRLLDPDDPEQQQEIATKYETVREKLQKLEPRPKVPPS